jgi:CheY-like chemotaxis protein
VAEPEGEGLVNQSDYCILVAEDNEIMRYMLTKTFSDNRYCVIEAGDGREAMRRVAEYDGLIHVLITTVDLPGIRGHELRTGVLRVHLEQRAVHAEPDALRVLAVPA